MLRRILVLASAAALLSACSDSSLAPSSHSSAQHPLLDLRAALTAQRRHTTALLKIPGGVGTAVTTPSGGRAGGRAVPPPGADRAPAFRRPQKAPGPGADGILRRTSRHHRGNDRRAG